MRQATALLAFMVAAVAYGAPVAELKGLRLGMTPAQVNALHPELQCAPDSDECYLDMTTVSGKTALDELGGFSARKWELHFVDGKLGKVGAILSERHDDELAAALTQKYGRPRSTSAPMTNSFGASFVWRILEWRAPGGTLSLVNTGNDQYPTSVDLIGPAWAKHREQAGKSAAKRRSGDL